MRGQLKGKGKGKGKKENKIARMNMAKTMPFSLSSFHKWLN